MADVPRRLTVAALAAASPEERLTFVYDVRDGRTVALPGPADWPLRAIEWRDDAPRTAAVDVTGDAALISDVRIVRDLEAEVRRYVIAEAERTRRPGMDATSVRLREVLRHGRPWRWAVPAPARGIMVSEASDPATFAPPEVWPPAPGGAWDT